MATSVPDGEMEYEPGEDVIDISSFLPQTQNSSTIGIDIQNAYQEIENTILEPLYFADSTEEQNEPHQEEQPAQEETGDGRTCDEEQPSTSQGAAVTPGRRRFGSGFRRQPRKLPTALNGLMGEANLRYARGDKETAVKICLEIIRQVPTAPEPFQTLAGIYDEMGDQEKFLQMSLVAAHLTSTDVYQWQHLAEMFEQRSNIKQAISCYNHAIHLDVEDLEIHKKRAVLLEKIGAKKVAIKGYMKLLCVLNPSKGEYIMTCARYVAELCHADNDLLRANSALETAIEKVPQLVDHELVNLHLELLIQLKNYRRCLDVVCSFCGVVIDETKDETPNRILSCSVPDSTPVDIVSKLIVALIHLGAAELINELMLPLEELDIADIGELYLDIADALTECGNHLQAAPILNSLVHSSAYSLPAVWLKYGDNLKVLGHKEEAVEAYRKVLDVAPQHNQARMSLAGMLEQLGRDNEAVTALSQEQECSTGGVLDAALLYRKCQILRRDPNRAKDLVALSQILFLRHSTKIRNMDELTAISTIQRYDRKRNAVKQVRKCRKEPENDVDVPEFKKSSNGDDDPSLEDEWELFKHVCHLSVELKMYNVFQQMVFTAQLSTLFHNFKYEIDALSVLAAYYNGDTHSGYNIVRTLVVKNQDNPKLWHLFNLIVTKSDDARHNRFIMRQLSRNSNHPALGILHGNNCLVSGTYKYAMHEYSTTYSKNPTPLCALLLGLTYLQMAAQKFTSKKHLLVMQALGLLDDYKEKRGAQGIQEVHYNLGRGFHHLGLYSSAVHHYKKVLQTSSTNRLAIENPTMFDLSREAAFNLHLIYTQSGSYDLARLYLHKYIIV